MKEYKLPFRTLLLWSIRVTFLTALLLAGFIFLCRFAEIFRLFVFAVPFIYAVVLVFYLPALFKSCKIQFVNGAVVVKRGVLISNCHILPFSRMIYTQTLITPLSRILKVRAVTLKAARSRIFVPELKEDDIESFLNELSKGGEV